MDKIQPNLIEAKNATELAYGHREDGNFAEEFNLYHIPSNQLTEREISHFMPDHSNVKGAQNAIMLQIPGEAYTLYAELGRQPRTPLTERKITTYQLKVTSEGELSVNRTEEGRLSGRATLEAPVQGGWYFISRYPKPRHEQSGSNETKESGNWGHIDACREAIEQYKRSQTQKKGQKVLAHYPS